ncbi:sensor histidine kinase [Microtetraspora malaysiensis]|uniref:Sensor histidine kinase n=1 Tax=Microtetraspora malaysiensis TaxID=161358 RepID=A0ABW6SIR8_9ACTN
MAEEQRPASANDAQIRRLTGVVIAVTAVLWSTVPVTYLLAGGGLPALAAGAILSGLLVLYGRAVHRHVAGVPQGRARVWALCAIVAVVYGLWPVFTEMWIYMPSIAGAAAMLMLPVRGAAAMLVAVTLAQVIGLALLGKGPAEVLFGTVNVLATAVVQFGVVHYARFVRELRELRNSLAEAALCQDRLRVARELHDLLGQTLTSITLKLELALALVDVDRSRVRPELEAMMEITRDAQTEVKGVVDARSNLDLGAELSAAVALLELSGARCALHTGISEVDSEIGAELARVVREAATNIVRHSSARVCGIELAEVNGLILLRLSNDGVPPEGGSGPGRGSGLHGLRKRVERMGGELVAGGDGAGGFSVRVALPAEQGSERTAVGDSRTAG